MQCLYCTNQLTPTTRYEHVIACALGGRLRSRSIACDDCNNAIGADVDEPLSVAFEHVRYMLLVRDCKGNPPPTLTMQTEHGEQRLIPGEPSQLPRPIRRSKVENGRIEISVSARTHAEAAEVAAHELRRHGVEDLEGATDLVVGGIHDAKQPYTQPVSFQLAIGGETHLRAVAKIGLELLACYAPEVARLPLFADVRGHVRYGTKSDCAQFDYVNKPQCPYPIESMGHAPHSAIVWAHPGASCVAAVQLFGIFRFTVRLCETWDGEAFAYAYAVDPIAGKTVGKGPTPPPPPIPSSDFANRGWPKELAEKAMPFLTGLHDKLHGEVWLRRRIDEEITAASTGWSDKDAVNPEKMLELMRTVESKLAAAPKGFQRALDAEGVKTAVQKQLVRLGRRKKR